MRRHHVCALVIAAFATLMAAKPSAAETLRVGLDEDPVVLDPAQSGNLGERQVFAALCDKLVDISPDGQLVPKLATSWTIAPDGKSITLILRKGVVFHDGVEKLAPGLSVWWYRCRGTSLWSRSAC